MPTQLIYTSIESTSVVYADIKKILITKKIIPKNRGNYGSDL